MPIYGISKQPVLISGTSTCAHMRCNRVFFFIYVYQRTISVSLKFMGISDFLACSIVFFIKTMNKGYIKNMLIKGYQNHYSCTRCTPMSDGYTFKTRKLSFVKYIIDIKIAICWNFLKITK